MDDWEKEMEEIEKEEKTKKKKKGKDSFKALPITITKSTITIM